MPREISVAWGSTLVCGARLSQQWSGACLSYTLRVVCSTPLAPLMASVDFPQEPVYGQSRSADMAVLVMCADVLSVSPCQTCLARLR